MLELGTRVKINEDGGTKGIVVGHDLTGAPLVRFDTFVPGDKPMAVSECNLKVIDKLPWLWPGARVTYWGVNVKKHGTPGIVTSIFGREYINARPSSVCFVSDDGGFRATVSTKRVRFVEQTLTASLDLAHEMSKTAVASFKHLADAEQQAKSRAVPCSAMNGGKKFNFMRWMDDTDFYTEHGVGVMTVLAPPPVIPPQAPPTFLDKPTQHSDYFTEVRYDTPQTRDRWEHYWQKGTVAQRAVRATVAAITSIWRR